MLQAPTPGLTSVIVVAADSGADLLECIERVLRASGAAEIIVSDNDSRDGSIEAAAERWRDEPRLRMLRHGRNLGFGTGCNRGAAVARGDALLFLNPDCSIDTDTLVRLRACLAADPLIGLLGARIVGRDGRAEPASRRRDPLLRRALATLTGLDRFAPRWPSLAGTTLGSAEQLPKMELVEAVSGALMLLPRAVFERLAGFDEAYFLHCEDLDLCRRVRDARLNVACANTIFVTHGKGTSGRRRPFFVAWHKHRGMWRWFSRYDPAARNPLLRALVWCGLWTHYLLSTPRYAWARLRAR